MTIQYLNIFLFLKAWLGLPTTHKIACFRKKDFTYRYVRGIVKIYIYINNKRNEKTSRSLFEFTCFYSCFPVSIQNEINRPSHLESKYVILQGNMKSWIRKSIILNFSSFLNEENTKCLFLSYKKYVTLCFFLLFFQRVWSPYIKNTFNYVRFMGARVTQGYGGAWK
jgi:hypothetical protein